MLREMSAKLPARRSEQVLREVRPAALGAFGRPLGGGDQLRAARRRRSRRLGPAGNAASLGPAGANMKVERTARDFMTNVPFVNDSQLVEDR